MYIVVQHVLFATMQVALLYYYLSNIAKNALEIKY